MANETASTRQDLHGEIRVRPLAENYLLGTVGGKEEDEDKRTKYVLVKRA